MVRSGIIINGSRRRLIFLVLFNYIAFIYYHFAVLIYYQAVFIMLAFIMPFQAPRHVFPPDQLCGRGDIS